MLKYKYNLRIERSVLSTVVGSVYIPFCGPLEDYLMTIRVN